MAHCRMLAKQGIITDDEGLQILEALAMIMRELDRGEITFYDDYEDITSKNNELRSFISYRI